MIDTEKYEGHAKEGWHFDSAHVLRDGYDKEIAELVGEDWLDDKATQELIADAPLLLTEVKRLGEQVSLAYDWIDAHYLLDDTELEAFKAYVGIGDEK